jgi:hypothetical protein
LVVSQEIGDRTVEAVRNALQAVCAEPALSSVRETLLLEGVDLTPDTTFARVLELEQQAE